MGRRPGACLGDVLPARSGFASDFYHRRYCQRGNRSHPTSNRRPLRGKALSRATVYRRGFENLWEVGMNNAGGKEDFRIRLLIVDDEQSIRKLCVTVGEALGFVCLEADSGDSALALLEEQPAHMVLTDMVMPHMSGLEFLERVKKLLPRIEVAVMTGHGSIAPA